MGSDPLCQHLRVLRGYRGQIQRATGWVRLPGPEKETTESHQDRTDLLLIQMELLMQVSASLPEQQMLLGRSGSQTLALVLEEVAEHFRILGQGLNNSGLKQASLPQLRLPQEAVEQLELCGLHLHSTSPHPQQATVVHLRVQNKRSVML